jgi:hypothetical protein
MKKRIATIIFLILSLIAFGFGLLYVFRENLMGYHIAFLGVNTSELNEFSPRVLQLYLALMRVAGSCMIAIGIGALLITLIPHKNEEPWAWWTLFVLFSASLTPMYFVTHHIARYIPEGQPKPPSILVLIMLGLLLISLVLSCPYFKRKKEKAS